MHRRIVLLPVMVVMASVLLLRTDVQAAPPVDPARAEHERIVRYWTPDRADRARPRDLDRAPAQQARPGGGGGGGGGTSTAVTGAAWTGGGLVKVTTGKVLFTLSGIDYVCSGSVVADARTDASLVLTAGHCAYDDAGDVFASNWMFVPDYESGRTFNCAAARFGCWTAQALVTTSAWRDSDFNEDYAFAVVGAGGKSGEALQLDAVVGSQPISFSLAYPREVFAFGYPAAKKYSGQTLVYCSGMTVADTFGGSTDYGLACDMTGGSSGGPWFANFNRSTGTGTLTSVNSFKYNGLAKYMFGPYFDAYGQKTYQAALGATGDTLVAP